MVDPRLYMYVDKLGWINLLCMRTFDASKKPSVRRPAACELQRPSVTRFSRLGRLRQSKEPPRRIVHRMTPLLVSTLSPFKRILTGGNTGKYIKFKNLF